MTVPYAAGAEFDSESGAAFSADKEKGPEVVRTDDSAEPSSPLKGFRKALLVSLLCAAQFFDIFTASAAIAALPTIGDQLHFSSGVLPWVLTAYTLTFGAFQVPAGRLSDIYHPKPVFCIGFFSVGVFSILCAVSVDPIMLLVFRALCGLSAAMTVPSAISILVQSFPDPKEQSDVLGTFGAFGAIGNCAGLVISGILSARASWRWVFYLIAICVIPFSIASVFLLPKTTQQLSDRKRSLDLPGISILTAALILFVYAISDGNTAGWGSPQIITTLVFSVVLFVAFFIVERYVKDPALPSSTWSNKNFAPMFFYSWSVYWFFLTIESQLVQIFQDLWHWSPLGAAIHAIPIGVAGGTAAYLTGVYGHLIPKRILLVSGQVFMIVGAVLFALAKDPSNYWPYIFPGMIVGMIGLSAAYVGSNVTTMAGARKGEEGVVGAVLYTSYQMGSTIGIAVAAAVTLGVNNKQPLDALSQYQGYAASFWSLAAMHGIMIVITLLFVRD
ncbi:hypothetical protein PHLCEN_2v891 [Hermanssonia centrifuga]|uniref:Major facilitator superfamily (MFS) profile domain-containing protein n=1 Tax=Hermanssonia centrifuga TaxID=98765 RepID=A0A2R6S4S7_9APHY|nr:hypothetical protein PHLCEN_2v891 [Hermanssonia centrifuga]